MSDAKRLYKVLAKSEWESAVESGSFSGCGIDLTDGFIHLSDGGQVVSTVQRYFANQSGLLLITFDSSQFATDLKWEPSRDGALFPHVYGEIPTDSAVDVWSLGIDKDGKHVFPEHLRES